MNIIGLSWTDDEAYYKQITKGGIIDGSYDDIQDIGASQIVINYFIKVFSLCEGVLYVNDNSIGKSRGKIVDNCKLIWLVNQILWFMILMVSTDIIIIKYQAH